MVQLLGGLGAGLAVIMVLAAWRLSTGPVSLGFLNPYIEKTFNAADHPFTLRLDDTILTWAGWRRALDIRIVNARAVGADGLIIARIPQLSVSLSAQAIVRGLVAPKRIELFGPKLRLVRHEDGNIEMEFPESTGPSAILFGGLLKQLLSEPDPSNAMSYLDRVNIWDADLTLEDQKLGVSWKMPFTQMALKREAQGISGEVSFDLQVNGGRTHFTILGDYRPTGRRLDLGIAFGEIVPAVFAGLTPEFEPLDAFDLPVQGTVTASITADGVIEGVGFDLYAGDGHITLPAPLAQTLHLVSAELRGRYEGSTGKLEIGELVADMGPSGELFLPAPTNHRMPLKKIRASGRYLREKARLEVDALTADLHGPNAAIAAVIDGIGGAMTVAVKGDLRNLPVDGFRRYWPDAWGRDAQEWCVANLSDGIVRQANASLKLSTDEKGNFKVEELGGDMSFEGVTVNYMSPMPKIKKVSAKAAFDKKSYRVDVTGGYSKGLSVAGGKINITGLDAYDQFLDLDLVIDGSFKNAMELIDHRPLGYAGTVGIWPGKTAGDASTRLKLKFLVEKTMTPDQIKVSATSDLRNIFISDAVLGQDMSKGSLKLVLDNHGMDVTGKVTLGTIPATLSWRENFGVEANYQSRYLVRGRIDDKQRTTELGLDFPPFWGEVVNGAMDADIRYTVYPGDRGRLEAKVDLKDTVLALNALGWSKEKGAPGEAAVDLSLTNDGLRGASKFKVNAGDLKMAGSVEYAANGSGMRRIDLDSLVYGRTDLKGALVPIPDGGWSITVAGDSFDLAPLWEDVLTGKSGAGENEEAAASALPRFSISADLKEVWLAPKRQARLVKGTVVYDGKKWRNIDIQGVTGLKKRFFVSVQPDKKGDRLVSVQAEDAGIALRTFGIYNNMVGGTLDVSGKFDDLKLGAPLKGRVKIKKYRVVDAPTLAQFVSILAITGLLEALQGDGLVFTTLEAPFIYKDGTISVADARASGLSLGFTAGGTIDVGSQEVSMEGTVVPAYAINSALGKIPVLGELLTGGEKGGGVFAAKYKMTGPMNDPKVALDPLSVLAPGFLRDIFGGLAFGKGEPEVPETAEQREEREQRESEVQ